MLLFKASLRDIAQAEFAGQSFIFALFTACQPTLLERPWIFAVPPINQGLYT